MKYRYIIILILIIASCSSRHIKEETYEDGQLRSRISYKKDQFDGPIEIYYENGQLGTKGQHVRNKTHGIWKNWYRNGRLSSIVEYNHGKITNLDSWDSIGVAMIVDCSGKAISHYSNGNPRKQESYKDCQMDGKWITWYDDGQIESEIFFEMGKKVGIWKFWSSDGTIEKTENY